MKTFSESLREHLKNMIDFENKKIIPLKKEQLKSAEDTKLY